MYAIQKYKQNIVNKINKALGKKLAGAPDLTLPPSPETGDFSFACFSLAKKMRKSPNEIAGELANRIKPCQTVKSVEAAGPYVNFKLREKKLAKNVLNEIVKQKDKYGAVKLGNPLKPAAGRLRIIVEFAHPNTHKQFHIGHLRNIITGESVCRILENAGCKVARANYQGDVGMHIAKCIWGVSKKPKEFAAVAEKDLDAKIAFLGRAYSSGSMSYEKSKKAKAEINEINKRVYQNDKSIRKIYHETRKWSLQCFDKIYKRVGVRFDRLYFESEVFAEGKKIVLQNIKKGIFKTSEGAVIFEGGRHGLHNRVFITSDGYPTYEAKDMALAKLQFKEYNPAEILHVVGSEQVEYFKVIIRALELVLPKSKGREKHLQYGWVRLKKGKMSSRLGKVLLGEWLLDEVKSAVGKIAENTEGIRDKNALSEKVSLAAVKYSMLKNGLARDIAFDIKESISLSGNSGPYLQYTYARIQSILRKAGKAKFKNTEIQLTASLREEEKQIILKLSLFPETAREAAEKYEPSLIAKYLFELAREFNDYYHKVPVLKAGANEKKFRLALIQTVAVVIEKGLDLLGIETVERM